MISPPISHLPSRKTQPHPTLSSSSPIPRQAHTRQRQPPHRVRHPRQNAQNEIIDDTLQDEEQHQKRTDALDGPDGRRRRGRVLFFQALIEHDVRGCGHGLDFGRCCVVGGWVGGGVGVGVWRRRGLVFHGRGLDGRCGVISRGCDGIGV